MAGAVPHLALHEAARRFGHRRVLGPLSLEFVPGSVVAVAGPSGSGKSTLLRLLMGALAVTNGAVYVDEVDLTTMGPTQLRRYRHRCGIVDQEALVISELSIHQNIIAGLVPAWPWYRVLISAVWPVQRRRVYALLEQVGLAERQWDRAGHLSGGQKQRVALARALVSAPQVIFADEPTAALDPGTAAEVIDLMAAEARRRGASLFICTHRLSQVLGAVDRVIGLRNGVLVLDQTAQSIVEADLDTLYEGSRERG